MSMTKKIKSSDLIKENELHVHVSAKCPDCREVIHLTTQTGDDIGKIPWINKCWVCCCIFKVEG